MNPKQLFGLAGGFLVVYVVITLTNKPHVAPHDAANAASAAPDRTTATPAGPSLTSSGGPLGFCLPGVGADTLGNADTDALLSALPGKAGWVAVSPALYQADGYAAAVAADPQQTPSDASIAHAIRQAHDQGLQVLLRPVVVSKDGARRERFTPSDPTAWFKSYAQALSPWIDLAEAEHVEVLSLGANYAQIEAGVPWDDLVRQARGRYHGKLTYGAGMREESGNGGYQKLAFWKSLDYVGLECPLPEAVGAAGDESGMASAWSDSGRAISDWLSASLGDRQVIFTSVGYAPAAVDAGAAYRAFRQTLGSERWVAAANWYEYRADLDTPRTVERTDDGKEREDRATPNLDAPRAGGDETGGAPDASTNQ